MEISEKVKIFVKDREEEIETRIDTGAEISMINEEILIKLGAPHVGNRIIDFGGQKKELMPQYAILQMKIRDCITPGLFVLGGRKNLIGHDVLQKIKAVINEGKGTVDIPIDDGTLEI